MKVIRPEGRLTIDTVKDLGSEILALLETRADFALDLSGVDGIDAAGMQLLVSFVGENSHLGMNSEILGALEPSAAGDLARLGFVNRDGDVPSTWVSVVESLAWDSGK